MSPEVALAGVIAIGLLATALVTIAIDRFSKPPHWPDTQDDERIIDIIKRGEVIPFRRVD